MSPGGRPKRLRELTRTSVYLPRELMARVDSIAGHGQRSETIRIALALWLARIDELTEPIAELRPGTPGPEFHDPATGQGRR